MAEPVVAVEETVPVVRNQIKVTAVGRVYKYVTYARDLLNKGANEVVIRAMGGAISNAIIVASLLRRGVLGLAQITDVTSKGVESNVKRPEQTMVPQIVIRLSANFSDEDKTHYGYQEALPEDQHVPFEDRPRAHSSAENVGGPEEGGQPIPHHQQQPHYFHHQQPHHHHHHQHQPHHQQQHPGQQHHHHHQQPHHQQQQAYHLHPAPHHLQQQPHHQHPGQHFHQHQGDQGQAPRRHSYGRYNGNHHHNNNNVAGGAPIVNNNNGGNVGAGVGVPNEGLNGGVGIAPNNGAGNYYGGRGGYRGSRGRSGPTSGYRGRGGFRPNYNNRGYGQDGRQPRAPFDPNANNNNNNNGEILDGRAPRRHFYQPKYEVPLVAAPAAASSSSSSSSSAAPAPAAAAPAPAAAPEAAVPAAAPQ